MNRKMELEISLIAGNHVGYKNILAYDFTDAKNCFKGRSLYSVVVEWGWKAYGLVQ